MVRDIVIEQCPTCGHWMVAGRIRHPVDALIDGSLRPLAVCDECFRRFRRENASLTAGRMLREVTDDEAGRD